MKITRRTNITAPFQIQPRGLASGALLVFAFTVIAPGCSQESSTMPGTGGAAAGTGGAAAGTGGA
ncbi:MAG: hypothetical protein H7X95_10405, partial [Deltaproteobacteria bacterium]|nr:hypothetical protein [Deltaproteobacteria bacterium]